MQLGEFLKTKTEIGDQVFIYDGWTRVEVTIDCEDLVIGCLSPTYREREISEVVVLCYGKKYVRLKD